MREEDGSIVPPGAFLPAVERYNLSQRLDRWVISTRAAVAGGESGNDRSASRACT